MLNLGACICGVTCAELSAAAFAAGAPAGGIGAWGEGAAGATASGIGAWGAGAPARDIDACDAGAGDTFSCGAWAEACAAAGRFLEGSSPEAVAAGRLRIAPS